MNIDILRSFAETRAGDDEIVQGITYGVCRDLLAERDKLRKAIEKHRRDMWGDMTVGHIYDIQLYGALGKEE